MGIKVTLTAYKLGLSEDDFFWWKTYASAHIERALGFEVEVDQFAFRAAKSLHRNSVRGATAEQETAILDWLAHDGLDVWRRREVGIQARIR